MPSDADLFEAIKSVVWNVLCGVHTCLPGRIEKYDHVKQKAEVKPLLRKHYVDGEVKELPLIANVPVLWPRTADFVLSAPLVKGDGVLLLFAERSLDEWLSEGGLATPQYRRKFDLSDAVAIPGLYSFKGNGPIQGNDDVQVRYKGASIRIKPDGEIVLSGSKFTLGADVKKLVTEAFKTMFNDHVHNFTAAPSGSFSTSTPANLTTGTPGTPAGGAPATFISEIGDDELTSKTEAE